MVLMLSSCEGTLDDVFGEWDRPANKTSEETTPANNDVAYLDYSSDPTSAATKKWNLSEFTEIKSDMGTSWSAGNYVLKEDVTFTEDITLTGDVNIVLCDGKTLTIKAKLSSTYNLNIYAQSTDVATAGKLDVAPTGTAGGDAITVKDLQIHGGTFEATGAKNIVTSGTGGYGITTTGIITFYAGKVTATGGDSTNGASDNGGKGIFCEGKEITIYQAEVTATGGNALNGTGGWAIYCNGDSSDPQLTIKGGTVKATGGDGTDAGAHGVRCKTTVDSGKLYAQGGNNTNTPGLPSYGMYGPLYFATTLTCSAGTTADCTEKTSLDHSETDAIDEIDYQYMKVE